jgi:chemotaxis receptor (MCP) glutamine deamidase CheD
MNRLDQELSVGYRKSSGMYFAEQSTLVVAVLGSCVAITTFNRRASVGDVYLKRLMRLNDPDIEQ